MEFKVNYEEAQEFGAIEDGDYEVVVFNVTEEAAKNGSEFINFDLVVRNDVPQKFKNSHIFHKIWKSKDTGKYNRGSVMAMAKHFKLPDGKSYRSFQDFLADFGLRIARVKIKNETSEYGGKTYENTNIKKFVGTQFPELAHQFKGKETPVNNSVQEISDDDLPF